MDDTLANNIALGKPHATQEEIINAARKAHIHHVIESLPQGYETRAGEAGSALSGENASGWRLRALFLKMLRLCYWTSLRHRWTANRNIMCSKR